MVSPVAYRMNIASALRIFRAVCSANDTQPSLSLILAHAGLLTYTLAGTSPQGRNLNSTRYKMPRDARSKPQPVRDFPGKYGGNTARRCICRLACCTRIVEACISLFLSALYAAQRL